MQEGFAGEVSAMNTTQIERITLPLSGLSYGGGGALLIERRLARTVGVVYVYVNAATEMAYIAYDCTLIDPQQLVTVVNQAGFQAGEPCVR